jgi:hypothetical protein
VLLVVQAADTWGLRSHVDGERLKMRDQIGDISVWQKSSYWNNGDERPNTRHFLLRQRNIRDCNLEAIRTAEAKGYDEVIPLPRFTYSL